MKGEETPLFFLPPIFIDMTKKKEIYIPTNMGSKKVSPWNRFYKIISVKHGDKAKRLIK